MTPAWETLQRAGVPLGTRTGPPILGEPRALVDAVNAALEGPASERQRVSLLAWLRGWAADWPSDFERTFGARGAEFLKRAQEGELDIGRYLKLRRIARETLSLVL